MKHKTKGFIAMILALCLMMSLGVGALAQGPDLDEGEGRGSDQDSSGGNVPETYTVDFGYVPNVIFPNITYSVKDGESSPVTDGAFIPSGAKITVNVSAASGYRVGNITYRLGNGDEMTIQNGGTFELTANATIMMHYVQLYGITCQQDANGSVEASVKEAAEGDKFLRMGHSVWLSWCPWS